jgi:hypothetical protein
MLELLESENTFLGDMLMGVVRNLNLRTKKRSQKDKRFGSKGWIPSLNEIRSLKKIIVEYYDFK